MIFFPNSRSHLITPVVPGFDLDLPAEKVQGLVERNNILRTSPVFTPSPFGLYEEPSVIYFLNYVYIDSNLTDALDQP